MSTCNNNNSGDVQPRSRNNNKSILVKASWVENLLNSNNPTRSSSCNKFVILEVSCAETNDNSGCFFEKTSLRYIPINNDSFSSENNNLNHIPGAICLHPSYFEAGNDTSKYYPYYKTYHDGNLLPDGELIDAVLDLGIEATTLVVVVGNVINGLEVEKEVVVNGESKKTTPTTTSTGQEVVNGESKSTTPTTTTSTGHAVSAMVAARVVWALMYCGVQDVRMLDGGLNAWKLHKKNRLSKTSSQHQHQDEDNKTHHHTVVQAPSQFRRPDRFNDLNVCTGKHFLASTDEVAQIAGEEEEVKTSGSGILVDIRRRGEYDGTKKDAYPFFQIAGSIPNAVYQGNWDILVDQESGELKPVNEIERYWCDELGLTPEPGKSVIFFCGTGWRSSIGFLLGYMMGWKTVKNYDDGWFGWCSLMGLEKG